MKRSVTMALAGLALVAGLSTTAMAQGGGGGGGGRGGMGQMDPARMMELYFKGIELTADQQTRVKAVQEKYAPKMTEARQAMMAARQAGGGPNPELMQKMRALQDEQRDSLRAVLTDAQKPAFDKNMEEMATMRRRPPGGSIRASEPQG